MELPAEIPENGIFPTSVSLPNDMPSKYEVVEEAPRGAGEEIVERHPLLPQTLCQAGSILFRADDVEITAEEDLFPHGNKIANPDVDGINVRLAELDPRFIPVRRAVYPNENEGRELQNNAATFGIESWLVD
jgi:hypothetical protein